MKIRKHRPDLAGWGITVRCNLSCPHCYSSAKRNARDELSTLECFGIIDEMVEMGVKVIGWTGGEPLLRDDLEDLIAYARETGNIRSGITTNGILLDEKRAKSLKKAGVASIQISLDGSTPARNRKIRLAKESDFEKIIEGIKICNKLDMKVHMAMLLGEENINDAEDFIRLAGSLGVKMIRFCCFVPSGHGSKDFVQERLLFNKKLPALKALVQKYIESEDPLVLFDPGFGPTPPDYYYHPCIAGVSFFYLSHDGSVYPCTSLLDDKFVVGNIKERSLMDLWHDPRMIAISSFPRREITGHCRQCEYFQVCRGACRGITYAHTGDLRASLPTCLNCVSDQAAEVENILSSASAPNKICKS